MCPDETTDSIRWIDTDIMLADPLTKSMAGEKLIEALRTNKWDLKQSIESLRKKRLKQKQCSEAKNTKKENTRIVTPAEAPEEAEDSYK